MEFKEIIDRFSSARIAVVGDVMLDKYIHGFVERISPEAPMPVFKKAIGKEIYELGGAANVAANIASLGGNAFLFGYIGEDDVGRILVECAGEKNIETFFFKVLKQTTQKTRFIAQRHHPLFRLDEEESRENIKIPENIEVKLAQEIKKINPDIIIAADYNKGCLTESLFSKLKELKCRIFVDPKPQNSENYKGVYLITPNLEEGGEISGCRGIDEIGKKLYEKFNSNILLKRSSEGMSLFEDGKRSDIPCQSREVCYVAGAGDSVIAVMALSISAGASLEESAKLASYAAGVVVGKSGTSIISKKELEEEIIFGARKSKLKDLSELAEIRKDLARKGKTVVWTNGCFDLLHQGHVYLINESKKSGDVLFVGINNDSSIRELKGNDRPIQSELHRADILSSLGAVDFVVIFPELTAVNCLREIKPDIYIKGGDYDLKSMEQEERETIESYGGKIKFIPIKTETSTTKIINKIKGG